MMKKMGRTSFRIALMAVFAMSCLGTGFSAQAMEKAEADERTNPLAMERCCIDERNNPLSQQSIARTPGTATLKPGQRLPVQNGRP